MALPKIEVPTYEMTLPSRDEKIGFRPFTVKEEKILMIASESEKKDEIFNAVTNMINACTFNKLDVKKLPLFDIEYIFLQIRSKSVGEIAKFRVVCPDDLETYADVEVDISKVDVHVDDEHTNKIIVNEEKQIGVLMLQMCLLQTIIPTSLNSFKNRLEIWGPEFWIPRPGF